MKKIITLSLLSLGIALGTSYAFAKPPCPNGYSWVVFIMQGKPVGMCVPNGPVGQP